MDHAQHYDREREERSAASGGAVLGVGVVIVIATVSCALLFGAAWLAMSLLELA